jgi:succinyl-CoA:acetate CoA-transferase
MRGASDRIGSSRIEFETNKLEAIVYSDRRDSAYDFRNPTQVDQTISENLMEFLQDEIERSAIFDKSLHIQFGVGSLGNALMGTLETIATPDRDLIYYGEVIQDGLLELISSDRIAGASATSLALSKEGQKELFGDIELYSENIVLRPADISNNPALIRRFGVVAVNSALEVDLSGHANSTHVNGTEMVNGIGGSGDFNRNAILTICALSSTADGGDIPRVVPMVPHVDHTEHDIDVIVTEQGIADLRGRAPVERARTIINNCAHPRYRDRLQEYLSAASTQSGHIPHDLSESPWDWR